MSADRYQKGDMPTDSDQGLGSVVRSIADELKGKNIVDWYQQMFEKATTFASILASVMFSAMVLDLNTSKIPYGNESEVRVWSATGAMLFVILVLLCTGCSLGLKFRGDGIATRYGKGEMSVFFLLAASSFLFQGLLLSGTCFFCLVLKAYAPAIGWTAFAITAFCTLVCFIVWVLELIIEFPRHARRRRQVRQEARRQSDTG